MPKKILLIGYGNPGRGDDGLGPALADRVEELNLPNVTVERDYQLTIEHAAMAAEHDVVIFADAALDAGSEFYFRPVKPSPGEKYSSHSVNPGEVLLIAKSCFNANPEAYALGIRASSLEIFEEGLSDSARDALEAALQHLLQFLEQQEGS